ncbi:MAG TPA: lysylphosphatidylglycerol synthase transmembrane domain-containing protein [Streptosporangiaceae bacterium]|nr:lysylphosphatidylglycerol synthase transmembrane domain-containing protein [Streptosporangiaceae bacterium]
MPSQAGAIQVTDRLDRRIRKPVDLLRCITSGIEIIVLAVAGVAASATTTGVETDIVGASGRLHTLLVVARPLVLFGILIIPVALAVRQLFRRQVQRLAEAVITGVLAAVVAAVINVALEREFAARLYDAIIMSRPGASHAAALDPYLAGLVAYATIIGLSGRPGWRNALSLAVGVYALVHLVDLDTTVLSLLITLLVGRTIGLGVRYVAGSPSLRPSAVEIATALNSADRKVTEMARLRSVPGTPDRAGSRHYAATTSAGNRLDVTVYDKDQQAAGAVYRLYRSVLLRGQVSRGAPVSTDRTVERRALLTYAAEDADAPTPRLRAVVRVGPEATVLAFDHHEGTTLAERNPANPGVTDAELRNIWDAVSLLHEHRVTHRSLTADRMLLTSDDQVMLLDPGDGDVAASDLQIRLDVAQLLAELALYVGPERAADLALAKAGADELVAVVPLLQRAALARSTRAALRRRRDVLPALRQRLLAAVPGGEVAPVQLQRIRLRSLVTLVATVAAVYLLAGELARASLGHVTRAADWRWGLIALALSAVTYVGAALELSGFVVERLNFVRTLLAQLAGSFVTLVTPAAVGGAAINIRYLQRRKIPAPVAAASVGVVQVVALVLHVLMLIVFVAIAGAADKHAFRPPTWAYFVLAGLVVAAGVVLALPAGRRLLRARVAPTLGQVLPRLLEIAQQPRKLAEGVGGALLLTLAYILCLAACVKAFHGSAAFAGIAVVYLTGSALGSIIPTPGGIGAVEAALTAGLVATGLHGTEAASAVLLFRLLTFWFPVPVGWVALNYLERKDAI